MSVLDVVSIEPQSPTLKIDGTNLAADVMDDVIEVRVSRSIGVAARCEVRVRDPEFKHYGILVGKLGTAIEVGLTTESSTAVLLKADITQVDVEGSGREQFVSIVGFDRSHKLSRTAVVDVYLNVTYGDVVSQIARRHGLTAQVSGLPAVSFAHLTQASTDLAMLERIALLTGAEWYVDDAQLSMAVRSDSGSPVVQLTYGENLLSASVRRSLADQTSEVTVRGWDPKRKETIVGTKTRSGGSSFAGAARTAANFVQSVDEANALAAGIDARIGSSHHSMRCEVAVCVPTILPGKWVTLANMGAASGDYYVTGVDHVVTTGRPFSTRVTAGGVDDTSLVELLAGDRGQQGPLGSGVTIGIVTNNNDEEQKCRVKLKLPALDEQKETDWVRIAVPDGGPNRGWRFVPEVNDEVLVAFEHGDLRRPYVIGSLWNGKDAPPTVAALEQGKVPERSIRSRTGHTITMRDGTSADKKNVEIKLSDGQTMLKLGEDNVQLISNTKTIEVKHSQAQLVIADNGDITLKGMNITIDAKQNLTLKGLNIESKAQVKAATEASVLELKSKGVGSVEATGPLTLKGAIVKVN